EGDVAPSSDMYALGVLTYFLSTYALPYSLADLSQPLGQDTYKQRMQRLQYLCSNKKLVALVGGLLSLEAGSRPTAAQALKHPFVLLGV
ncbi:hypothetical protein EON63_21975, partial [archaeon]